MLFSSYISRNYTCVSDKKRRYVRGRHTAPPLLILSYATIKILGRGTASQISQQYLASHHISAVRARKE
ncbi:uncharacterized protein TrAFT101_002804 [Trichoderma asperellum]|uniref:uncharacterized protein n=1 Tax=Trichoderma asperellum TaxID=101201 RepID=UPI0033221E0D|nr:hypothetical protein TrAFT101_002804 [Trichoderma asperellum]